MPKTVLRAILLCSAGAAVAVAAVLLFRARSMPPPIPDGEYAVRNSATKLALDDPYSSTLSGEQIIQWDWNEGPNQKWIFSHRTNGCYTIRNRKSGLFLTDPGGRTDREVPLQQQTARNDDSQLWCLSQSGKSFVISNKARHLRIQDASKTSKLGSGVILSPPSREHDQKASWAISRST